ncbi:unnamed protein product [Closterium sp. NIES-64]|nr:unnamed protein product [Closterium sp. NIES-64]
MEAVRCVAALRLSSFPSQTLSAKIPRRITKESPSVLRVSCDSSAESTLSRSAPRKSSEADTWQDVERRSPFLERETTGFVSNSVYLADTTTLLPGSHTPLDDEDDFSHDFAEDERLTRIGESVDTWEDRKVGEFMTPNPLCFRTETSLCAAAKALLRYRLTGAPVVEPLEGDAVGMGRLVGVLSQRDLLWKQRKPFPSEEDKIHRLSCYYGNLNHGPMVDTLRHQITKIMSEKVGESMTDTPVYVEADALVSDAAELMLNHNIARLPVVAPVGDEDGRMTVVGIITESDVLRHAHRML